jgi:hypothetical protein
VKNYNIFIKRSPVPLAPEKKFAERERETKMLNPVFKTLKK